MSDDEFRLGAAMVGGGANPARAKPDNEFHPTPEEAIDALMLREGGSIRRWSRVWDPCCGNGAIAHGLEHYKINVVGTDLIDRGFGRGALDFLKWEGPPPSTAIVSNFPFSLAEKFVLQARALGIRYIATLLNTGFWHAADRGRLWEIWRPAIVYELTFRLDFLDLGNPVMNCKWVIWDAQHTGPETFFRRMDAAPPRGQGNLLGAAR